MIRASAKWWWWPMKLPFHDLPIKNVFRVERYLSSRKKRSSLFYAYFKNLPQQLYSSRSLPTPLSKHTNLDQLWGRNLNKTFWPTDILQYIAWQGLVSSKTSVVRKSLHWELWLKVDKSIRCSVDKLVTTWNWVRPEYKDHPTSVVAQLVLQGQITLILYVRSS